MLKFDKNLSAIHAYLCADGYVIRNPETQKNKYYYIGLRNTCETLLEDFEKRFNLYFGVKPRRCKDGRSVVQNKELYYLLTEDFSYYSREWTMPDLSKINLRVWLRTFFDCEGWVLVREHQDRHIGLDSINHKGLNKVKKALEKLGIKSKMKYLEKRKMSRLFIFGKENLIKFQKEVDFLHPDKKRKLREAIDSYVNYYWGFSNKEKLLSNLIKNKSGKRIRICSIKKVNLLKLSEYLTKKKIEHKIYSRENQYSKYFELTVQKKESVKKILKYRR